MDRSYTPLHQPARLTADDAFTRISGGITRWALGWGLLSLHATIFTIAMIGMLFWNIYDSPNDIWVDEVFRRWGVVLAFHAIAVAAGLTAWRLIKAEQASLMAEPPQWTAPPTRPAQAISAQSLPTQIELTGWAPFPVQQPMIPVAPSRSRRYLATMQRADAAFGRGLAASATWTGIYSRRVAGSLSSSVSGLLARGKQSETTTIPDPAFNWPESPVRHRPEDEEFISRFAGNGANGLNGASGGSGATSSGVDIVLDVSGVSPDDGRRSGTPLIKGPGQSWVQAATYTWQVPHETQAGITPAAQNGHAASPPDMTSAPDAAPPPADD
jgi:hypothetical protein